MSRNMKRQLEKFKEELKSNLSRSSKAEKNADGLQEIEREVDRYKDILQNLNKRIATNVSAGQPQDAVVREKRCKKVPEFQLGQLMEESVKDLPGGLLRDVLDTCARVEKLIATEIVNNEMNVENSVNQKLNKLIETHLGPIQKQKRVVTKCQQEYEASRQKYDSAQRNSDQAGNTAKIIQLKDDQEELHTKLEKERDLYESCMYELLAEEENIALLVKEYVKHQELYFTSVLREVQHTMSSMDGLFRRNNKQIFNTSLRDHLKATNRKIAYVIELCVCTLLEKGLYEEGLLRVGCASSKLRRMISAINANYVAPPLADKYCDPHVVAGVLKNYLRSLPDPLLTYEFYPKFVQAAQKPNETQRKAAILDVINQLPKENYDNLRYLTKFLSYLAEKNQENKMSTQNIAIVMSPNLLWSPKEDENYLDKVNTTATVNTIVEALVADWAFFFDGEVQFYVSMTRDALFPDNGGFPFDKDQPVRSVGAPQAGSGAGSGDMMSRSMFVTPTIVPSTVAATMAGGSSQDELRLGRGEGGGGGGGVTAAGISHSRSSSHDTSLILINSSSNNNSSSGSTDQLKNRSRSNSSLSDHSSPPQENSPKLPLRRRHNKQVAPTPPDNHHHHHHQQQQHQGGGKSRGGEVNNKLQATHYFRQLSSSTAGMAGGGNIGEDEGFASLQHHAYKQAQAEYERQPMLRAESHDNLLKLKTTEKVPPPRPAAVSVDSQVLGKIKASVTTNNTQQQQQQQQHQNKQQQQPNAPNCDTNNFSSSKENKENNNRAAAASVFPPPKPVALPRTTVPTMGVGKPVGANGGSHTEHDPTAAGGDTMATGGGTVTIREKPVIPERPATLMRPMSFKGSIPEISRVNEVGSSSGGLSLGSASSLKKAQSFRGETNHRNVSADKPPPAPTEALGVGGTLERTQIYNIDKQQVAFIDVVERADEDSSAGQKHTKHTSARKERPEPLSTVSHLLDPNSSSAFPSSSTAPQGTPPLAMMESTGSLGSDLQSPVNPTMPPPPSTGVSASNSSNATITNTTTTSLQHVPQSPRGIDQKIKRPQVPAPPPPVGRPKSSDSTDL
uniref:Rho-GAP domain-containing protein n=1 Tax=Anopheles atroparvus TaxID=41427 RepID=A0AAG5DXB1_ANOAO